MNHLRIALLYMIAIGLVTAGTLMTGGESRVNASAAVASPKPFFNPDTVYAVTTTNVLIRFDSATPGTVTTIGAITGLQAGENILGIDFRPATGQLYALGSTSRLYTINLTTAAATLVGSVFGTPLNGTEFGFDFNPVVDRIRVVSNADQNFRLNPDTGAIAAIDPNLAFIMGDPNFGTNPNVVGAAYTNNVSGTSVTTLFDIDSGLDILVRQGGVDGTPSPNGGQLATIGNLGVSTNDLVGFDISQAGVAFASLTNPDTGLSSLYTINLTTGQATLVGAISTMGGQLAIRALAVAPICTITCPANITVSNDPNQCGAVVNYPSPLPTEDCGLVNCSPAPGSFFPVGTTTVTCTTASGPACSFTITVIDTQPPSITCPANVTTAPTQVCVLTAPLGPVVTFPPPTASDNCPGVTTVCNPPSGSTFPIGTTIVTCTATDASGNTATCSFTVTVFNGCLQDDSNPGNVVLFNTFTGEYVFCCNGVLLASGTGTVTRQGCDFTIQHNATDRRVLIRTSFTYKRGSASLQMPPGSLRCTITDRDITNNTCVCGAAPPNGV